VIDKIWKSIQEASSQLMQQADELGKGAKEKAFKLIEEWIAVFPLLEEEHLLITSFALGISISPTLEVEFSGMHADFTPEKLEYLLNKYKDNTIMVSILRTIQTTYKLHSNLQSPLKEPLVVKARIGISPEVKVFLGEPVIEQ